jgi:hypothetical protein
MLWYARALHTSAIDGKESNKDVYILEGKEQHETTTIGKGGGGLYYLWIKQNYPDIFVFKKKILKPGYSLTTIMLEDNEEEM